MTAPAGQQPATTRRGRVVIIGGGFGGLFAARALRGGPFTVTLIDRNVQHVFQPLLYQCATGILSEGQITSPLRRLLRDHRNLRCVLAEAVDVDPAGRTVICRKPEADRMDIPYDHLIVAAGVRQSYFGHDEFAAWAPGMKTIDDALTVRRRVFGAFEMAETAADPVERQRWLTFACVGAGPTGVELAGQIREVATKTLGNEYRRANPRDARVLLFDGGTKPLAAFGDKLSQKATEELQKLGVELHMGSIVTNVDGDGLTARDHAGNETHYEAKTVLWTAGVQAVPFAKVLAQATGAQTDRAGRIVVQDDLTIAGHPEISVIGDMMSLRELPGVAEVAMQEGLYAGRRVRRELEMTGADGTAEPFKYRDLGSAAYIARGRAVVSVGRLKLSGFPGWVAWLFVHIAFLTGFRNRVGAILTWWLPFTRDIRRERAITTRQVGFVRDVYEPLPEPPRQRRASKTPGGADKPDSTQTPGSTGTTSGTETPSTPRPGALPAGCEPSTRAYRDTREPRRAACSSPWSSGSPPPSLSWPRRACSRMCWRQRRAARAWQRWHPRWSRCCWCWPAGQPSRTAAR
jgi:NADH:ubiquinone reductase (H+-translocating)